ncbi:LysR family transcriptional regulator [Vibrio cyclitrophicus]
MDLATRLELLLEVSKAGSFAKAADRLNVDRSVLSKQVKQLEEHLGVRLINRTTRSLSFTHVGKQIVEQAVKVSELLEDTENIAACFYKEPIGNLRISSTTLFGRRFLQKAVEEFLTRYPRASIELILDDSRVDLVGEGFDIVFRIGPMRDSSVIAKKLADNKTVIVASEAFIDKHGMPRSPEELTMLPSIIYSHAGFVADKVQFYLESNTGELETYALKGNYRVNEPELIVESIKASLGFGQIGQFMLNEGLAEQGLVQLLPEREIPSFGDIYAMYTHRKQSPLVLAFIEIVQEIIGTPPSWEKHFA